MINFLKKLFGIGQDAPVDLPASHPVIEEEKNIVVEKKTTKLVKAKTPKKEKTVRTTKKREKPALKVVKVEEAAPKKRGRPAKKK